MDVNYLLYREQVSRMRAEQAKSAGARRSHRGLADGYAALIRDHRDGRDSPGWPS